MRNRLRKILVPAVITLAAAMQSFGVDYTRASKFMDVQDSVLNVKAIDTIKIPVGLDSLDPFKFKYFLALRDSATMAKTRDSLLNAGDTLELHKLDSLFIKDSIEVAKQKELDHYNSLSKKERKKIDYEKKLQIKIKRADSLMARKDSIQKRKDSIIESTPRILETYVLPDSMQYKRLITWTHSRNFNNISLEEQDTSYNYHFNDLPNFKNDVNASYLGVSGSASQTYNFFKRKETDGAIFYTPYEVWTYTPETLTQYNTKTPYTELNYWGTLFANRAKEESNIKILTTQNILPELNLTLEYRRSGGEGILRNENTNNRTAQVSTNYLGKRYLMHAGFIYNKVRKGENGGIIDNTWITDTLVDAREIKVALSAANNVYSKKTVFLDQSYRIPFNFLKKIGKKKLPEDERRPQEERAAADSSQNDNVTTAFIGHCSEYSVYTKLYQDNIAKNDKEGRAFYNDAFYLNPTQSSDSMRVMKFENKAFIRLQPWSEDGIVSKLDVGIGDKLMSYYMFDPTSYFQSPHNTLLNSAYLYAGAEGKFKKYFYWDANGKYNFAGYEVNDFLIEGNMTFNMYPFRRYKKSPLTLAAHFETSLKEPDYYQQHFLSNHYKWDNDFSKISMTKLEGRLSIPRWELSAGFGYSLLGNNIYYDNLGIVRQNSTPMSVLSADLTKNFTLWKLHLDHQALFQLSSNEEVLPLPMLGLNFRYYFQFDVKKNVMQMQIGANATYTTKWYAPAFNPVLGVFHNQTEVLYGNCPYIDAFVNIQWKRACIFVKYVNAGMGWLMEPEDYFSAHHYIRPQRALRFGIHWPFYVQTARPSSQGSENSSSGGGRGLR